MCLSHIPMCLFKKVWSQQEKNGPTLWDPNRFYGCTLTIYCRMTIQPFGKLCQSVLWSTGGNTLPNSYRLNSSIFQAEAAVAKISPSVHWRAEENIFSWYNRHGSARGRKPSRRRPVTGHRPNFSASSDDWRLAFAFELFKLCLMKWQFIKYL